MNHKGTVVIKTERLVLRPFNPDDSEEMFYNWANDSEVTRFLSWNKHESISETQDILRLWCREYSNPTYYHWCITINNVAIGSIGIVSYKEEEQLAEIGFCMSRKYWNKGIMTEALLAIKTFLTDVVGYKILIGGHHELNLASGKVFLKSGFTRDKKADLYEKYADMDFRVIAYSFKNN